jgi:hypothetical protein
MKNLWKLIHTSNLYVSSTYDSLLKYYTAKPVYVGHLWLHSKHPNVYRRKIYGNHYTMETNCAIITCANVHFRVQKQVVEFENNSLTSLMSRDLKYSNGSVATRKFQSVVHTCGEWTEDGWTAGRSANEWGLRPPVQHDIKTTQHFRLASIGSTKCETGPRFKIYRWPSYGVMTTYNIIGILRFRISVANCNRWLTDKSGQLQMFYCIKPLLDLLGTSKSMYIWWKLFEGNLWRMSLPPPPPPNGKKTSNPYPFNKDY